MSGYVGSGPDFERNLNMRMIEDNDDVIIPDDMRQFLQQQRLAEQQHHASQADRDLQQGATTPTAQPSSSIDEWVQQTNSVNHIRATSYPYGSQ